MPADRVKVNGTEYPIPKEFTLGEIALLEDITGGRMDDGIDLGTAKGTLGLVTVSVGRANPRYGLEEAKQLLPSDVEFLDAPEETPTKAAGKRKAASK